MFELIKCKERAHQSFHEHFSEILQEMGYTRQSTGYYLADVENGYILSVALRPTPTGDIADVDVGLSPISDNWLFFHEKDLDRHDDPEALCHQGQYGMLFTFYGFDEALRDRGKMEGFVESLYTAFMKTVRPILLTVHDEKSCFEAMRAMDKIFICKSASQFIYTMVACGYIKRAKSRIKRIKGYSDLHYEQKEEFDHLLQLLEEERMDEVQQIIDDKRKLAKERYYAYVKHWGY